ncbi:M14 family metallopeptidase [Deinococcus maricopensis]|uniref:carboxypeptidase T n=1 Tax=Deinococcus maricopensis (strain DSM 21211 / LMG 22137 / NRRL B-23946 / LB-34) TaxID=709986 RepID=E8UB75_DEIML|nr:M14 family metallopeptidase [Deinococcus maricopensis]ADV68314.1 Carboxypeptidase A [Deinococcus maricopensis DSM 21211]
MHQKKAILLSLSLVLAACGQGTPTARVPEQQSGTDQTTASGVATASECNTFKHAPMVITRIDYTRERDAIDILKSFESLAFDRQAKYLLLDVSLADFERLRQTGQERGFTVRIDEARTAEQTRAALGMNMQAISSQYPCYRTVEETYAAARQMTVDYPNLASWTAIGSSWLKTRGQGGYDMYVLKLTNKNITGTKPKMVVTSAIHAREYTTAELMTRFAEKLVQGYGKDPDITWMLDHQEVHLILQTNPDGRKKAEAGTLWRKNVNTTACPTSSTKQGVDLNRNFAFGWGGPGAGTTACDETYRGPSAASEPEVQAVQNYLKAVFPDQKGPNRSDAAPSTTSGIYMDIHSYSQLVLWPWGDTSTLPPNATALQTLGRKFAYYNGYTPEQAVGLYPTSGTTDDYAYGELGVAAYTIELGNAFFESCTSFVNDVIPKNMPALMFALKAARAPYQLGAGPEPLKATAPANVTAGSSFTLTATLNNTQYNNSNGAEPTRTVSGASYFIDTPPWAGGTARAMTAADGSFNSGVEGVTAQVSTAGLSKGRHTVFIQGRNTSGYNGVVSAVFVNVQ